MAERFTPPRANVSYFRTKPQVVVFVLMAVPTYFECISQSALVWFAWFLLLWLFHSHRFRLQCK